MEQVRERQGDDGNTYWTYDHISQVSSARAAAQACYILISEVQVESVPVLECLLPAFSARSQQLLTAQMLQLQQQQQLQMLSSLETNPFHMQ